MPTGETKHERFLRLMQRRLERGTEELRLIGQLSSHNYENTPEEAEEVVRILDEGIREIAGSFGVEYVTRIGKAASLGTPGSKPLAPTLRKAPVLDEIEVAKMLEHLRASRLDEVEKTLRAAIMGKAA